MKASTNPHLQLKMRICLLNWWCIYNINSIIKTSMQLQCQKLVFSFSKVIWHQRCTEPLTVTVHPHVRKNFQVLQRSVISCLLLDHIFSKAFVTLATLSVLWCRTRLLFMAKLLSHWLHWVFSGAVLEYYLWQSFQWIVNWYVFYLWGWIMCSTFGAFSGVVPKHTNLYRSLGACAAKCPR